MRVTLALPLLVAVLVPSALAQTNAVDLTSAFILNGAVIEGLTVVQISDVVVIRGKTNDAIKSQAVSRIANTLGYPRVANLIVIRDDAADDAAIVYTGQRRLELEPALEGCRFRIASLRGVVRLTGGVRQEAQEELAVYILSKINGVKEVHPKLARL
jgi:osmotically-inducible protein OsmY